MEFNVGDKHRVTVQKILNGGIIVSLDNGETEFIHKSKISNDFIVNIEDFVSIGDVYTASVIVGKNMPTELTLREDNHIGIKAQAKPHTNTSKSVNLATKSTYTPAPNKSPATLEEMIANSTKVMQDKLRGRNKDNGARSRNRRVSRNRKG